MVEGSVVWNCRGIRRQTTSPKCRWTGGGATPGPKKSWPLIEQKKTPCGTKQFIFVMCQGWPSSYNKHAVTLFQYFYGLTPSFARTGKDYHRRWYDMYLSGVMGKNLACNAEEQSGHPPNPPQPKWKWYMYMLWPLISWANDGVSA